MTTPDPVELEAVELLLGEVVVAVLVALLFFAGFSIAIVRAGRLPHPASLVTALCLLTFMSLIGFIITEAESLSTIAASGVGAIAAAVASTYQRNGSPDD